MGKATVERFVQQGVKVVLCDLPASKSNELAKTLGEDKVLFVPVDVGIEGITYFVTSSMNFTGHF